MFKDVHETKFVFYSYVEVDRLLALKIFKGQTIIRYALQRRANKVGANQPFTILCWENLARKKWSSIAAHECSRLSTAQRIHGNLRGS